MNRPDTIELCKRDIEILAYIQKNPKTIISSIARTFNLPYRKANRMVTKYVIGEYVSKTPKEKIVPGGDQFEFSLSERGIQFLDNIYKTLQNSREI